MIEGDICERGIDDMLDLETPAAWRATDLASDRSWVFALDDAARSHLSQAVKKSYVPDRPLLDYRRTDIDLGPAHGLIAAAIDA